MKKELYNYDIYPKVFPAKQDVLITLQPLGCHAAFREPEYRITVHRVDGGSPRVAFTAWNQVDFTVKPSGDGKLRFTVHADVECEYFIRVWRKSGERVVQLSVYALEADLACRIPVRGDLHLHSCRSDGKEDPAVLAANYRRAGYDFLSITDHLRYYPSLEAMQKYKDVPLGLNLVCGEEVQLPGTEVHIINFGGTFSVNGLLESGKNYLETAGALQGRCAGTAAPDTLSQEEYENAIRRIEDTLVLPQGVDPHSYAVCLWAFDRIREADGLGIFAHPYWIQDVWHIPEAFTAYMMEQHPFDAFEVLGGESYYQQNGYQTALYYEQWKAGRVLPIVGSTDSHGSTEHNDKALIATTIVFAHENERKAIINAIKDKYSVAVDTISKEYRIVGELRYQKYACFLLDNWYPLHDIVCQMEGALMKDWYCSDDKDTTGLAFTKAKMEALFARYFLKQ